MDNTNNHNRLDNTNGIYNDAHFENNVEFDLGTVYTNWPSLKSSGPIFVETIDTTPYMVTVEEFKSGAVTFNNFTNGDDIFCVLPEASDFGTFTNNLFSCSFYNESGGVSDIRNLHITTGGSDTFYGLGVTDLHIKGAGWNQFMEIGISPGNPIYQLPYVVKLGGNNNVIAQIGIEGGTQAIPLTPTYNKVIMDTIVDENNHQLIDADLINNRIIIKYTNEFDIGLHVVVEKTSGGNSDAQFNLRINGSDIPHNSTIILSRGGRSNSAFYEFKNLLIVANDYIEIWATSASSDHIITGALLFVSGKY
jgi:hypothetical protein